MKYFPDSRPLDEQLQEAVESYLEDRIEPLLRAGADPNISDSRGWAPLIHYAARRPGMTRAMVRGGADIDAVDDGGKTTLHHQLCVRDVTWPTTALQLIRCGASTVICSKSGESMIDSLALHPDTLERPHLISYLYDTGARPNSTSAKTLVLQVCGFKRCWYSFWFLKFSIRHLIDNSLWFLKSSIRYLFNKE